MTYEDRNGILAHFSEVFILRGKAAGNKGVGSPQSAVSRLTGDWRLFVGDLLLRFLILCEDLIFPRSSMRYLMAAGHQEL